jgi:uncharacterized protein with HEPN domain
MSDNRLTDYLNHIVQAAADARSFVEGMTKDVFLGDRRTQRAGGGIPAVVRAELA